MQKGTYGMITFAKKKLKSRGYGYFWRETRFLILKGHMKREYFYGVCIALSQPEWNLWAFSLKLFNL